MELLSVPPPGEGHCRHDDDRDLGHEYREHRNERCCGSGSRSKRAQVPPSLFRVADILRDVEVAVSATPETVADPSEARGAAAFAARVRDAPAFSYAAVFATYGVL